MTYMIPKEHSQHVRDAAVAAQILGWNLITTLSDGTCVLCEINRLHTRISDLLFSNTEEVEKRRAYQNVNWIEAIQVEQAKWAVDNFGQQQWYEPFTGVVEEMGELHMTLPVSVTLGKLAHSLLKSHQNIRGTRAEHEAEAKDAVGDILIYLLSLCSIMKWSMLDILRETWIKIVKKRNWKKNPKDGIVQTTVFPPDKQDGESGIALDPENA